MAVHETVTPSGIQIVFEDGEPDPDTGKSKRRQYTVNGDKLPSITTVCGMLDKPGLPYAAEKLTVKACLDLARGGELPTTVDGTLSRLKARDLRFYQVWQKKAERGRVSHEDLVRLCLGQETVDVRTLPADQQEFVRALSGWFADNRPRIEEAEQMSASVVHGYSGRPDIFGVVPTVHPTLKGLIEVKTTEMLPRYKGGGVKAPYPENLFQLAGQELARRESGREPSDYQAVLRVDAWGAVDLFTTVVDPESFLALLGAYRAAKGLPSKPHDVAEVMAA